MKPGSAQKRQRQKLTTPSFNHVVVIRSPGAQTSKSGPVLDPLDTLSLIPVAPAVHAVGSLPGLKFPTLVAPLPAATAAKTSPLCTMDLTALFMADE